MFIENHWIFAEYRKVFRHYIPSIFVQEQMLATVTDRMAWRDTCFDWAMNDYKPSSVGKMLDYYRQKIEGRDNRMRFQSRVGTNGDAQPEPQCRTCCDLKTVYVKKPGAEFDWEMEDTPCPDCVGVE